MRKYLDELAAGGEVGGELDVQALAEIGGHGEGAIVTDEDQDVVGAVHQRGAMAAIGEVPLHALAQRGVNVVIEVLSDVTPDLVPAHFHLFPLPLQMPATQIGNNTVAHLQTRP